jgi:hypothetical protein
MMKRKLKQNSKRGYFELDFDDESDVVKYYKDGGGECWHDVGITLIEHWAKEHGYQASLNLINFVEFTIKGGLAEDFVSMVESRTSATSTWISMGDMG